MNIVLPWNWIKDIQKCLKKSFRPLLSFIIYRPNFVCYHPFQSLNDCTLNIVKRSWNDSNLAFSLVQENLNGYDFCFLHKKNDAGGNRYNVYNQLI